MELDLPLNIASQLPLRLVDEMDRLHNRRHTPYTAPLQTGFYGEETWWRLPKLAGFWQLGFNPLHLQGQLDREKGLPDHHI
jgi:hypothetical protein